jgi:monofunctional biosynthetic peptidoglycan transglycosylase
MGGVSTSQFQVLTNGCAVFSGTVRLENNGGFASVRSQPVRADLTGCDSFLLRVRGDGRRYKFSVRTEAGLDTPLYQLAFTTKRGEWEEHRLPFKDFVPTFRGRILTDVPLLDPAKITSVGFLIADKQAGAFRLEISVIRAWSALP